MKTSKITTIKLECPECESEEINQLWKARAYD